MFCLSFISVSLLNHNISYLRHSYAVMLSYLTSFAPLGTLRSNDADGNEIVKRTIGLISKTTTLHVHHAFLYIFLCPFLHDYDVNMPNFAFYGGRKQAMTKFYFSYCTWIWNL